MRLNQASQPTLASLPIPVQPKQTRSYLSQRRNKRSIGLSICQSGAPHCPKGQSFNRPSLICEGALGLSGITAHLPTFSRGSSHLKYGFQSLSSAQSLPILRADCQNENAPLSKHNGWAYCLNHLHIVWAIERYAKGATSHLLQSCTRRHWCAVINYWLSHYSALLFCNE